MATQDSIPSAVQLPLFPSEKLCRVCGTAREPGRDCRHCANERGKRHYAAHREEKKAYARAYYRTHKERARQTQRAWYAAHPEEAREHARRYRERQGDALRQRQAAWREDNREHLAAYKAAYYAAHRETLIQKSRAWVSAHPERARQTREEWYQRNGDRVRADARARCAARTEEEKAADRAYKRAYHQLHQERDNAKNRARRAARTPEQRLEERDYQYRWRVVNRDKLRRKARERRVVHADYYRLCTRLRRARRAGSPGTYTRHDLALIYAAQRGCCAYCLAPLTPSYHVDHMIPIARGGSNWPSNLALACQPCNNRKFTRDVGQFMAVLIKERRAQAAR